MNKYIVVGLLSFLPFTVSATTPTEWLKIEISYIATTGITQERIQQLVIDYVTFKRNYLQEQSDLRREKQKASDKKSACNRLTENHGEKEQEWKDYFAETERLVREARTSDMKREIYQTRKIAEKTMLDALNSLGAERQASC